MKRPRAPTPASSRLRRFLFPILALGVALALLDSSPFSSSSFDPAGMRAQLAAGRVDEALQQLSQAGDGRLIPELMGVNWWPAEARANRLAAVAADAASLPPALGPELISPVGRQREAPRAALLSAAADEPLQIEVHASSLGLEAGKESVEAGQKVIPLGVVLLANTTYDVALTRPDGQLLSVVHFELLSSDSARDVGLVMATAHELGGGGPPGDLLAAIVALHFGLREEALLRFDALLDDGLLGGVARELLAVTLARLGRPADALARRDGTD